MKQRAIKRCVKRTQKALKAGRKFRTVTATTSLRGAVLCTRSVSAVILMHSDDVSYRCSGSWHRGHFHWLGSDNMVMAVSHA